MPAKIFIPTTFLSLFLFMFLSTVPTLAKPPEHDPYATEQQLADHDTDVQTLLLELLSKQQSWDQALPVAERFVLVMNGDAVLDNNTKLVWEQSPLTTRHTWFPARIQCMGRGVGGVKGWRLPSVHELNSLVAPGDPAGDPDLPAGHPFSNVQSSHYWSASTNAVSATNAWSVYFVNGDVANLNKGDGAHVWCVRGGQNHGDAS